MNLSRSKEKVKYKKKYIQQGSDAWIDLKNDYLTVSKTGHS